MRQTVALVGYMGSGKTSVGRFLAGRLGLEFADLDQEIEVRAGRSIPEIFASSGEEKFRELEHGALRDTVEGPTNRIVACGGGIVVLPENRALLKRTRTVFLEEDLGVLFERTRGPGRPLRGASKEEFERRYRERLPFYREVAGLTVTVGGRSRGEVVEEVERWLAG
ncbi:MAG: shikimate kinase [Rubrobacteraceae bacterium]